MEKKIILGTLAGGVAYFLLGWIIYGMLMMDFYSGETMEGVFKEIPDFPILFLGNLVSAYLLTHILSKWSHVKSAGDGAKTGLFYGLLMSAGLNLTMYSTSNIMTLKHAIVDIFVTGAMTAIVAAVIALIICGNKKAA